MNELVLSERPLRELALFAGAGGGILGGRLLGWQPRCAVEIDAYCRKVLLARQRDGTLPRFPIWDDVRTFDGRPWANEIDIITGGFPCQDISIAGKGAGIGGARSGLWREMARIIGEVGPRHVLVENSPMLRSRGLGTVIGDLAALGYDARWGVLGAADAGAPHRRARIWIVAHAAGHARDGRGHGPDTGEGLCARAAGGDRGDADMAHTDRERQPQPQRGERQKRRRTGHGGWWAAEPGVGRVAHGVADRVVRLRALGNGQVPAVAAIAFTILS